MKQAFNTAAQGVKDTINGMHFDSFGDGFRTILTAYYTGSTAYTLASYGVLPLFPAALAALCLYFTHQDGKQRREAGWPPRWIR